MYVWEGYSNNFVLIFFMFQAPDIIISDLDSKYHISYDDLILDESKYMLH